MKFLKRLFKKRTDMAQSKADAAFENAMREAENFKAEIPFMDEDRAEKLCKIMLGNMKNG